MRRTTSTEQERKTQELFRNVDRRIAWRERYSRHQAQQQRQRQ